MLMFVGIVLIVIVVAVLYLMKSKSDATTLIGGLNSQYVPAPEVQTPDEEMKAWEPKWGHLTRHEDIGLVNFTANELRFHHNPEPFAVHGIETGKVCIFKNKRDGKWVVTNIKNDGHAYSTGYYSDVDNALVSFIRRVVSTSDASGLQSQIKDDFIRSMSAYSP